MLQLYGLHGRSAAHMVSAALSAADDTSTALVAADTLPARLLTADCRAASLRFRAAFSCASRLSCAARHTHIVHVTADRGQHKSGGARVG